MGVVSGTFEDVRDFAGAGDGASLLAAVIKAADEVRSENGWPEGVRSLLAVLGREAGVNRVWLESVLEDSGTMYPRNIVFEWASSALYATVRSPLLAVRNDSLSCPEFRSLVDSRKRGEWQQAATNSLAPGGLRATLEKRGARSFLSVPVFLDGQWWGTLCLEDCTGERQWSDETIAAMRLAADLMINAILAERLSVARDQLELLMADSGMGMWSYDFSAHQARCSSEQHPALPQTASLRMVLRMIHPDDRKGLVKAVRRFVSNGEGEFSHDVRFMGGSDASWVELLARLERDEAGAPLRFAGIAVDIGDRKQEEERLKVEATSDPLTGVMNRIRFKQVLRDRVELSSQTGSPFVLLYLDLDNFTLINERYGREVGDNALRFFTDMCAQNLRANDAVARLGGDRFAVLLPGVRSDTAHNVGERIRRYLVSTPYVSGMSRVFMTTSVGMAVFASEAVSSERLMREAEVALVAAKKAGRNCLVAATDPRCMAVTEDDLRQAFPE